MDFPRANHLVDIAPFKLKPNFVDNTEEMEVRMNPPS